MSIPSVIPKRLVGHPAFNVGFFGVSMLGNYYLAQSGAETGNTEREASGYGFMGANAMGTTGGVMSMMLVMRQQKKLNTPGLHKFLNVGGIGLTGISLITKLFSGWGMIRAGLYPPRKDSRIEGEIKENWWEVLRGISQFSRDGLQFLMSIGVTTALMGAARAKAKLPNIVTGLGLATIPFAAADAWSRDDENMKKNFLCNVIAVLLSGGIKQR